MKKIIFSIVLLFILVIVLVLADELTIDTNPCPVSNVDISPVDYSNGIGGFVNVSCRVSFQKTPPSCNEPTLVWEWYNDTDWEVINQTSATDIYCGNENCWRGSITSKQWYYRNITNIDEGSYKVRCKSPNIMSGFTTSDIANYLFSDFTVSLETPPNNNATKIGNLTFECNASYGTKGIANLSFYHNITGIWNLNYTEYNSFINDTETLLLIHWNDNNNKTVNGDEPNWTNGTMQYKDAMFDEGLYFNSTSHSVQYNYSKILNTSDGTLEFWIKPDIDYDSVSKFLWIYSINASDRMYGAWFGSATTDLGFLFSTNNNNNVLYTSGLSMNREQFYHIAFTWNSSHQYIYVDGSLKASKCHGGFPRGIAEWLSLSQPNNPALTCNCTMDEFRIYNRLRATSEILSDAFLSPLNLTHNLTGIQEGTYDWSCLALSQNGSSKWAGNRTFSIDTTVPIITITNPTNSTYNLTEISLEYHYIEINPSECWYNLNNAAVGLADGSNTATVCMNDSLGQEDCDRVDFYNYLPTTEEENRIYMVVLVLAGILFVLSYWLKDRIFALISGFVLVLLAVFTARSHFFGISNDFITFSFIIIIAGLGFYLLAYHGYMFIQESWGYKK